MGGLQLIAGGEGRGKEHGWLNWPPARTDALVTPAERCRGREVASEMTSVCRLDARCHCPPQPGNNFVDHFAYDSWTKGLPDMGEESGACATGLTDFLYLSWIQAASQSTIDRPDGASRHLAFWQTAQARSAPRHTTRRTRTGKASSIPTLPTYWPPAGSTPP